MARPNRFQIMDLYKNEIISALEQKNPIILKIQDIESVLFIHKRKWKLPNSTTVNEFLDFLTNKKIIKFIEFGTPSRPTKRFIFENKNIKNNDFALSLFPNSYLSHFSAVTFHDLTNEIIKSIYINVEQSKKNNININKITEENIKYAFSKEPRLTNNYIDYNKHRIYIINGKNTENLGVIKFDETRVTDIERTLIDITVRPQYSGGIHEVLNIYKRAKGEASVNKIRAYLKKLEYNYPYHQAIGFLLEKAGYKENAIKLMEKLPIEQDFYLVHGMYEMNYSERWRLYYPKNM